MPKHYGKPMTGNHMVNKEGKTLAKGGSPKKTDDGVSHAMGYAKPGPVGPSPNADAQSRNR